jgi:hypothetical protein
MTKVSTLVINQLLRNISNKYDGRNFRNNFHWGRFEFDLVLGSGSNLLI